MPAAPSWSRRSTLLRARAEVALAWFPSSSRSRPLELQDMQAGIGVGQVHEAVRVHVAVRALNHLWPIRAGIDHARRIWRDVKPDLARVERVFDVEDANARVVVGG